VQIGQAYNLILSASLDQRLGRGLRMHLAGSGSAPGRLAIHGGRLISPTMLVGAERPEQVCTDQKGHEPIESSYAHRLLHATLDPGASIIHHSAEGGISEPLEMVAADT
jgi:hypothetical protein